MMHFLSQIMCLGIVEISSSHIRVLGDVCSDATVGKIFNKSECDSEGFSDFDVYFAI